MKNTQSPVLASPAVTHGNAPYTTVSAEAADGTPIGYRQLGEGPGLVIVHGAMSSAHNHMELAQALAADFTVYLVDRRGRGLSGPYAPSTGLAEEVQDLAAVLCKTQAPYALGVSSGAIVLLNTATQVPSLKRMAIFEPPFFADAAVPRAALARFDQELAEGKIAAALITGMLSAQMGPTLFQYLPRWLLAGMFQGAIRHEPPTDPAGYVAMRDLAPLLHQDFTIVAEAAQRFEIYREVTTPTLLLGGSKSPRYLRESVARLAAIMPRAECTEIAGANHAAPWNKDRGGAPLPIAAALRAYWRALS